MAFGRLGAIGNGFARLGRESAKAFVPSQLGSKLLADWDADRPDLITRDGSGLVSSWKDAVAAYDAVQASGSLKPIYSATGWRSVTGAVNFDGLDDYLQATLPASFPLAANGCYIFVVAQQDALPADGTTRYAFGYGGAASTGGRSFGRAVVSAANRVRIAVGDGAVGQAAAGATVDLSGRNLMFMSVGPTVTSAQINGVSDGTLSVIPNTTATSGRVRIGNPNNATSNPWQGPIRRVMMTLPTLTAKELSDLKSYLQSKV